MHSDSGKIGDKVYRQKLRNIIIDHYGGKCAKCGFSDRRALQIDHINGGGKREMKKMGCSLAFYLHIIKNNFPPTYQILCANCNWIKRFERNEYHK